MPNFVYFATFDDSISILREICTQGFHVITEPGLLDQPSAKSFASVTDELVGTLSLAPTFYLSGSFTRFPVQFNRLPTGTDPAKYAIDFLSEGPLMQCILGRVKTVEGVPKLLPGDVSYQRLYRNPDSNEWHEASADVKSAFRKAVSIIKKRCVPLSGRSAVIAPDALKLLESGKAKT